MKFSMGPWKTPDICPHMAKNKPQNYNIFMISILHNTYGLSHEYYKENWFIQ